MSQQNVEIVLRCYEACNRQDRDAAVADFHPEAEFRIADAVDKPLVHRGREAILDLFVGIWADWEVVTSEPLDTFDLGDLVLVRAVERRTGRDGIFAEHHGAQLWKLDENGLITSFEAFDSWDEALEAAERQQ